MIKVLNLVSIQGVDTRRILKEIKNYSMQLTVETLWSTTNRCI